MSIPKRVTVSKLVQDEGFEDVVEACELWVSEGICPAVCEDGCQVEPDGMCPHGHPSALIVLGMI